MENNSLLAVKVDFAQSHTLFPTIVLWVLLFLLALLFIFNGIPYLRALKNGEKKLSFSIEHIDKIRLGGTLLLSVAYFMLMDYVGAFFPNKGYGFLFVSMPFVFLLSLLYLHEFSSKKFIAVVLNAILAPSIAWALLAKLFNITLP